jgi:hypothetical protein
MRTFASSIAVAAIAFSLATPANAQVPRTWVSHNGLAGNAAAGCSAQQPCDTFANAFSVTALNGEINCLDSGSYGPVGITRSVTIDCSGQAGTIYTGLADGIQIYDATAAVKLRNLLINGFGSYGINITSVGSVTVENCVIRNFGIAGIYAAPTGSLQLNVTDSLIADQPNGGPFGGIMVVPQGSATVNFVFDHIRVENNIGNNIFVQASGTGLITGLIRDSVLTGSPGVGVYADAGNTGTATVSLTRTESINNANGVWANNGAAVILNNSTIQINGIGLKATNGGAVFSYGNNAINGNQPGGSASPILIGLH